MDATSYGEFSASIHKHYFGQRAPLEVSIEVTRRCPLECLQCYNNLPMGDLPARNRELSKEEHMRLLDDLAEMGTFWLLYSGGEIFARKDFLEIYTYAKQKGFIITLFSNGTLISDKIADYLAEWPPFAIEITLYGNTKETYDKLTGIPGAYERCMRGIEHLRQRKLPLKLKTVATTINKHEVFAMKRFAEETLGVEFKFDGLMNPRLDCSQSPLAVRLSPEDVVALDMHPPQNRIDYRRLAERDLAKQPALQDSENLYFCGGGINSFAINPYGEMSICVLSQQEVYNIREGSVKEGWEKFLTQIRLQKKRLRPTKCVTCRIQSLCSMCPAQGELENGDPESPVEFLCEVAHMRVMSLGYKVPQHGDCDCCNGSERHERLKASAHRIAAQEVDVEGWKAPSVLLPVLSNSSSGGSCGSCSSHG
jgi:radical SAM protein with 4Fe4S-binding SPASM domain